MIKRGEEIIAIVKELTFLFCVCFPPLKESNRQYEVVIIEVAVVSRSMGEGAGVTGRRCKE